MARRKNTPERGGEAYVEEMAAREKETQEITETAQAEELKRKEAEKETARTYREELKESEGKRGESEEVRAREEREREEKRAEGEEFKRGYLEEYGYVEKPEERAREAEQAKKELEEVEKERVKQDLKEAVDESAMNFLRNQIEIEKYDAKIEELEGKWFKGKQRMALREAKAIAMRSQTRSQNNIEELKIDYLGLGLEEEEIKKIVQESFERKGYSAEGVEEITRKMFPEEKEEGKEAGKKEEEEREKEKKGVGTPEWFEESAKEIDNLTGDVEKDAEGLIKIFAGIEISPKDLVRLIKEFEKEKGVSYKETVKKGRLTEKGKKALKYGGITIMFLLGVAMWKFGKWIEEMQKEGKEFGKGFGKGK